jgi:tetratricopeptide (TPR) repeat protein
VIERLLAAERALESGDLDRAGRLFQQVSDADPRNAIAVVGLALVAQRRGNEADASELVKRALAIDPEDGAAKRLREAFLEAPAAASANQPVPSSDAFDGSKAPGPRRSLLDRLRALLRRPA